ncbi:MAG: hypothetical protein P8P30_10320 [Rickettsiales bacterium]|nr:hypothetical protein [Rickettsiales bacterium]
MATNINCHYISLLLAFICIISFSNHSLAELPVEGDDVLIELSNAQYSLAKKFSDCAAVYATGSDLFKQEGDVNRAELMNGTKNGAKIASQMLLALSDYGRFFTKHSLAEASESEAEQLILKLRNSMSNHEGFHASIYDVQYPAYSILLSEMKDIGLIQQKIASCNALGELQGKIGAEVKEYLHGGNMSDNEYVLPIIWGERAPE